MNEDKLMCPLCGEEGFEWQLKAGEMKNSTVLHGVLCRRHYDIMLEAVRVIVEFGVKTEKEYKRMKKRFYGKNHLQTLP